MTNFLKKSLLILSVLFFTLFSCEKELYEETFYQEEIKKDFKVKSISFDEFNSKFEPSIKIPVLERQMISFETSKLQGRSSDSSSEIIIYTDKVIEITQGDYTSYTMHMKTPYSDETNFYNITLEERLDSTSVFITKYSTTNNWLNNQSEGYEGQITSFRLNENPSGGQNELQAYVDQIFESGGNSGGGSGGGGGSSNTYPFDCNGTVNTTYIIIPRMCSANVHWPWSPDEYKCDASVKAYFQTLVQYECIPNNDIGIGNPTGGNPTGGNTSGGGGGSSSGSNGSTNTSNQSLTTIVGEPMNAEDFAIEREKCLMKSSELSQAQKDWLNNPDNDDARKAIFDYLENNELSSLTLPPSCYSNSETINYALSLINHCIINNLTPEEAKEHIVANIIVKEIDDSELDECAKGILTDLKGLTQNKISEIFKKFDDLEKIYKTTIKSSSDLNDAYGDCDYVKNDNNEKIRFNYIINILSSHTSGSTKGTKIGIASTIIHELIHAYLFSIIDDCYINSQCTEIQSYPLLWEYFLSTREMGVINNGYNQHTVMVDFVNILASALQEYDTGLAVTSNNQLQQLYIDLAWGGLENTTEFNKFPIHIQTRIIARNQAECTNSPVIVQGLTIASPVGSTCN